MINEIIGAILVAVGIFIIYKLAESSKKDKEALSIGVLGLILIIGGGYVLLGSIKLYVLVKKIVGILFILLGGFFTFKFPSTTSYGIREFMNVAVLLGLFFIILGVWFVMF